MTWTFKNTLLWHALEEGTLTTEDVVRLTGWTFSRARTVISTCLLSTLLRRADEPRTQPAVYALTPAGIEAAMAIDKSTVDFAGDAVAPAAVTAPEKAAVLATPASPTRTEREARHAAMAKLSRELLDSPLLRDQHHQVVLEALITVFNAIALVHPCCAAMAAHACLLTAQRLHPSTDQRPDGASVH